MPINPAIALGVEPSKPVDILGAYGNALSLKNLVNQGRAQELQFQQAQREQDKQMRLSDLARQSGGDMEKFAAGYGAIDPFGAMDYGIKNKQLQMQQRKAALEQADGFNKLFLGSANAVKAAGYSQDVYNAELQRLRSLGVPEDMLANVPAQVSPQFIDANIQAGMTNADRLAREKEEFDRQYPGELGRLLYAQDQYRQQISRREEPTSQTSGQGSIDPETGMPRGSQVNVEAPVTPFDSVIARLRQGNENDPFLRDKTGKIIPNQPVQDLRKDVAKASATNVSVNTGKEGFNNERSLRNDFQALPVVKAHDQVRKAFAQINSSLDLKSPIGDIAASTKIMKLLDEDSVVRESELAAAMNASGLADRIRNLHNMILNKTISPQQRQEFRALAKQFYSESEKLFNEEAGRFSEIATSWGLKPERVIGPKRAAPAGVSDVKTKLGDQGNPYKIKGDDGFNALPSGAYFTGPDGVLRQKP